MSAQPTYEQVDIVSPEQLVAIRQAAGRRFFPFETEQLCKRLFACRPEELSRTDASRFIASINVLGTLKVNSDDWFTAKALVASRNNLAQTCAALRLLERHGEVVARGSGANREYGYPKNDPTQE